MAVSSLDPYLIFNGNASEAIAYYEKAIGAKVVQVSRYSDAPEGTHPPEVANHVMHARLEIDGHALLISDDNPGNEVTPGSNFWVTLQYPDTAQVDQHFAALAEGGSVVQALTDTFWGARFGMLTDRFGIRWMFNATR